MTELLFFSYLCSLEIIYIEKEKSTAKLLNYQKLTKALLGAYQSPMKKFLAVCVLIHINILTGEPFSVSFFPHILKSVSKKVVLASISWRTVPWLQQLVLWQTPRTEKNCPPHHPLSAAMVKQVHERMCLSAHHSLSLLTQHGRSRLQSLKSEPAQARVNLRPKETLH